MNMSDFAAMMANNGFDYSTPQQTTQNPPIPISRPSVNREQSDTDRLLAQLGAFTGPDTTQNQQRPIAPVNNDEVDALLASLNDGNVGGGDYSNFDFGDIDLGSLGDMSGLFGTSTIPVSDGQAQSGGQQAMQIPPNTNTNTNMPNTNTMPSNTMPSTNTMVPNTQPQVSSQSQSQPQAQQQMVQPRQQTQPQQQSQPQQQQQAQPQQQIQPQQQQQQQQQQPAPIKQEPPTTTTTIPTTDPNLDMSHVFDDSQAIDLDDFNFGDGDGEEGGIDLTGDEFENLLAAFN
jgi:DNA segregation ATPase FtsK/SpoIIIE-like protein